jgi:hypothetical protein
MMEQNCSNHRRYVPMFHVVLFLLVTLTFFGSCVNLYESWGNHDRIYSASLITVISFCLLLLFFFCRQFPLKAQDRAIRAEENLRHFVMTGKLLDPRLTIKQVIALRFAGDDEYLVLVKKALDENLSADMIKKSVKQWRADYHRV